MTTGLLLIVQMILYHMTAAAVYNYNETSEVIPYEPDPTFTGKILTFPEAGNV